MWCVGRYWSNDERWSAVSAEQREQLFKERFGSHAAAAAARKEVRNMHSPAVGACDMTQLHEGFCRAVAAPMPTYTHAQRHARHTLLCHAALHNTTRDTHTGSFLTSRPTLPYAVHTGCCHSPRLSAFTIYLLPTPSACGCVCRPCP